MVLPRRKEIVNMTNKLFVAGISYDLTDSQLADHFAQSGKVNSATIITDRSTGQSKGFGFVEMNTEQEAMDAMKKLDGTELAGRTIVVKEARPQEPNNRGGFNNNFNRDRRSNNSGNKRDRRSTNRW